ncbi:MAG TPA: ComEC/Rec2 family competence protein [Anaerolineae bacterium]
MKRGIAWLLGWRGAVALAVGLYLAWLAVQGLPDGRLHVYFLDVGQGDAILIRTPEGQHWLIDGGPSPAALLGELGEILPFWQRDLDLVALTHADDDHLAGLLALLPRYRVCRALATAWTGRDPAAASWRRAVAESGAEDIEARRGLQLISAGVGLTVLHPDGDAPTTQTAEGGNNNRSLVLRLDYGQTSFLLAGDAEESAEAEMLAAHMPVQAEVLKVGHHGSATATSARFLAAVAPRVAVIQVGAGNRFGHPAPAVLARLAAIPTYRTDLNGRIEIVSDGQQMWIKTDQTSARSASTSKASEVASPAASPW